MATVLFSRDNKAAETGNDSSQTSLTDVPALGVALEERRFWWQRATAYDPDAIATQVRHIHSKICLDIHWLTGSVTQKASVFDDPDTAEQYRPRDDW